MVGWGLVGRLLEYGGEWEEAVGVVVGDGGWFNRYFVVRFVVVSSRLL